MFRVVGVHERMNNCENGILIIYDQHICFSVSSSLLSFKGLCRWCPCPSSPTSATPPCCDPPRLTSQTSGRPGSVLEAPGSTLSSGPCRPSWAGAATGSRDPVPLAPSSGTSVHPPASHTCCVSSSSVCCCPFYSWSTPMAES